MSEDELDEIEARAVSLVVLSTLGGAGDEADRLIDENVPALIEEVRRLRSIVGAAHDACCCAQYGELYGFEPDKYYVVPVRQMHALGSALEAAGIEP